ncbi:unnamed protein product, partial [Owenia fusiformis]
VCIVLLTPFGETGTPTSRSDWTSHFVGNATSFDVNTSPGIGDDLGKRDTILIGNLIFSSYPLFYDACEFAQQAVIDVNNATDLFPLFRLELDPCLPKTSMMSANSKLWDYIIGGRNTPFIMSAFAGQEATVPVCSTWGCIV